MSIAKMVKANLITQVILFVISAVVFFVIALVSTRPGKVKKSTKDGFQTDEMQKIYDNYIEKEMKYGKPTE